MRCRQEVGGKGIGEELRDDGGLGDYLVFEDPIGVGDGGDEPALRGEVRSWND